MFWSGYTEENLKKETEIFFSPLNLNEIPHIMRNKMQWNIASELMSHWFNTHPAFAMTEELRNQYIGMPAINIPKDKVNVDIVKMEWAMQFDIIKESIQLLAQKWASPKGLNRLFEGNDSIFHLNKNHSLENIVYVGNSNDVLYLDTYAQVNIQRFSDSIFDKITQEVNELYGAIGAGTLKLCVRGYFDLSNGKKAFITEKIGFYIKDSYDFSSGIWFGYEPLGVWTKDGILDKAGSILYMLNYNNSDYYSIHKKWKEAVVPIFNKDFRAWQKKYNEGGDFIVFSDVYWTDPLDKDRIIYEPKFGV